jgi:hypothetical protein
MASLQKHEKYASFFEQWSSVSVLEQSVQLSNSGTDEFALIRQLPTAELDKLK